MVQAVDRHAGTLLFEPPSPRLITACSQLQVQVRSATSAKAKLSICVLDIDIKENKPNIKLHEQIENSSGWRGSELSLTVGGSWSSYRSFIVRYLRQMAVITPYAHFRLSVKTLAERATLSLEYHSDGLMAPWLPADPGVLTV